MHRQVTWRRCSLNEFVKQRIIYLMKKLHDEVVGCLSDILNLEKCRIFIIIKAVDYRVGWEGRMCGLLPTGHFDLSLL